MPLPGWYPDPDGTPGRFRYWDGTGWQAATTHDLDRSRPGDPRADPPRRARSGRLPLTITAVVIVLVLGLLIWLIIDQRTPPAVREDPADIPTAGVTGWDDSSPLPSAAPTPTAAPVSPSSAAGSVRPTAIDSGRPVGCDQYASADPDPVPDDGRVHGGPLSFPRLPGDWGAPVASNRFPFSRDGHSQSQPLPEELSWAASAHVGVSTLPGRPSGTRATGLLLQCVLTSDFYTSVDVRVTENSTTATSVGDSAATRRDTVVRFEHPQLETTGSRLRIVVVDSSPRTFYFHAVPVEREDLITELDRASSSLRLD